MNDFIAYVIDCFPGKSTNRIILDAINVIQKKRRFDKNHYLHNSTELYNLCLNKGKKINLTEYENMFQFLDELTILTIEQKEEVILRLL